MPKLLLMLLLSFSALELHAGTLKESGKRKLSNVLVCKPIRENQKKHLGKIIPGCDIIKV